MHGFETVEPQLAGNRWFKISPYDERYRGFHLMIGLWPDPALGGCCNGSLLGHYVQQRVDAALAGMHCRRDRVKPLNDEPPGCMSTLDVIRVRVPDPTSPDVYQALVDAYTAAIAAEDGGKPARQAD